MSHAAPALAAMQRALTEGKGVYVHCAQVLSLCRSSLDCIKLARVTRPSGAITLCFGCVGAFDEQYEDAAAAGALRYVIRATKKP
jgi:hypothetical protein